MKDAHVLTTSSQNIVPNETLMVTSTFISGPKRKSQEGVHHTLEYPKK